MGKVLKTLSGLLWLGILVASLTSARQSSASAQPIRAGMQAAQATVPPLPTNAPTPATARSAPPLSLTLMLAFTGCSVGAVILVLVIGAVASIRNKPKV